MEESSTESKEQRFVRLAENRVNRAIKDIKLIGNLCNRNNYQYSEEQVKKITDALSNEVKAVKQKFQESLAGDSGSNFRLR